MSITRRNILAGVGALPIAACIAPAPATATASPGVSVKLGALIEAAHHALAANGQHYREVVEPSELAAISAKAHIPHVAVSINDNAFFWTTANPSAVNVARSLVEADPDRLHCDAKGLRRLVAADLRRGREAKRIDRAFGVTAAEQRSDDLLQRASEAEFAVCRFPVETPSDFHAKMAFMVERQMFDGLDWSREMLADAACLADKEA